MSLTGVGLGLLVLSGNLPFGIIRVASERADQQRDVRDRWLRMDRAFLGQSSAEDGSRLSAMDALKILEGRWQSSCGLRFCVLDGRSLSAYSNRLYVAT